MSTPAPHVWTDRETSAGDLFDRWRDRVPASLGATYVRAVEAWLQAVAADYGETLHALPWSRLLSPRGLSLLEDHTQRARGPVELKALRSFLHHLARDLGIPAALDTTLGRALVIVRPRAFSSVRQEPMAVPPTVAAFLDWRAALGHDERPVRSAARTFVRWAAPDGTFSPEQLTRQHLLDYRDHLLRAVSERRITLKTASNHFRVACQWVSFLIERGYCPPIPLRDIPKIRDPRAVRDVVLTRAQLSDFFSALAELSPVPVLDVAFFLLMFLLGARSMEIRKLRVVDFRRREGRWYVTLHGRCDRERTVPVPEVAMAAVERVLQVDPPAAVDALVFRSAAGTMLSYEGRKTLFRRCARAAGLPKNIGGPHVLRRTFATLVAESGERSLAWLSGFLGHASSATTTVYVRPSRPWLKSEVGKLDGYLRRHQAGKE